MPFSLSISPPKVELSLRSNQNATKAYDIQNDSDNPLTLELSVLQWQPQGADGSIQFTKDTGPFKFYIVNADLRGKTEITIGPKAKQQVVIGIEQLQKDLSGEYYYTVLFGQKTQPSALTTTTQSSGQLGSHLILNIGVPTFSKTLQSQSFTTPLFVDNTFGDININGIFQNTSNHFFSLKGVLDFSKNGQTYKQIHLAGDTILAGHFRSLRCVDDINKPDPIASQCSLKASFPPGKYTISLRPAAGITLSQDASLTVIALPFGLLLLLFTTAMVLFIIYRLTLAKKK